MAFLQIIACREELPNKRCFKLVLWNDGTLYGRCISLLWRTTTKHVPAVWEWASLRDSDFPRASAPLGHCHNKLVYQRNAQQSQVNTTPLPCCAFTWTDSETYCNLLSIIETWKVQYKISETLIIAILICIEYVLCFCVSYISTVTIGSVRSTLDLVRLITIIHVKLQLIAQIHLRIW